MILAINYRYLLVYGEWRGHSEWYDPDDDDDQQTDRGGHVQLELSDDHEVPVDGDSEHRQRGHVDADPECHRHGVTQRLAERPRAQKTGQRREGHGQQTEQNVGGGKVTD